MADWKEDLAAHALGAQERLGAQSFSDAIYMLVDDWSEGVGTSELFHNFLDTVFENITNDGAARCTVDVAYLKGAFHSSQKKGATKRAIKTMMGEFGAVMSCTITDEGQGCTAWDASHALVTFSSEEAAAAAVAKGVRDGLRRELVVKLVNVASPSLGKLERLHLAAAPRKMKSFVEVSSLATELAKMQRDGVKKGQDEEKLAVLLVMAGGDDDVVTDKEDDHFMGAVVSGARKTQTTARLTLKGAASVIVNDLVLTKMAVKVSESHRARRHIWSLASSKSRAAVKFAHESHDCSGHAGAGLQPTSSFGPEHSDSDEEAVAVDPELATRSAAASVIQARARGRYVRRVAAKQLHLEQVSNRVEAERSRAAAAAAEKAAAAAEKAAAEKAAVEADAEEAAARERSRQRRREAEQARKIKVDPADAPSLQFWLPCRSPRRCGIVSEHIETAEERLARATEEVAGMKRKEVFDALKEHGLPSRGKEVDQEVDQRARLARTLSEPKPRPRQQFQESGMGSRSLHDLRGSIGSRKYQRRPGTVGRGAGQGAGQGGDEHWSGFTSKCLSVGVSEQSMPVFPMLAAVISRPRPVHRHPDDCCRGTSGCPGGGGTEHNKQCSESEGGTGPRRAGAGPAYGQAHGQAHGQAYGPAHGLGHELDAPRPLSPGRSAEYELQMRRVRSLLGCSRAAL